MCILFDCWTMKTVHFWQHVSETIDDIWDFPAKVLSAIMFEQKDFISPACRHRRGRQSLVPPLSSSPNFFFFFFSLHAASNTSMWWWMPFITEGWNRKWSENECFGKQPVTGAYTLVCRGISDMCLSTPTCSLGALDHTYSHYAVCTSLWNLMLLPSSPVPFFVPSLSCLFLLKFTHTNASTAWCSFMKGLIHFLSKSVL